MSDKTPEDLMDPEDLLKVLDELDEETYVQEGDAPDDFEDARTTRSTPDEIFKAMKDQRIDLEVEIFSVDRRSLGGKPVLNRKPWKVFDFCRKVGLDLQPDYDFIEDDLLVNAALYRHYSHMMNVAKRMRKRAEHELKLMRSQVRINLRENWNNPNIPAEALTKDYLESYVDVDKKVVLLQEIVDEIDFAVNELGNAVSAMRIKHESCRAIQQGRQGEKYLVGSSGSGVKTKSRDQVTRDEATAL